MQEYEKKSRLMTQHGRMLDSSLELTNVTIINPVLLFYMELELVCTNVYRFAQHTPNKGFDNTGQSTEKACCQRDENANSSVVAETVKLLANSSWLSDHGSQSPFSYNVFE